MEYFIILFLVYVGTVLLSRGVTLITLAKIIKDLAKHGYKLDRDYFLNDYLNIDKDLFVPIINLLESLNLSYAYFNKKEAFLYHILGSNVCTNLSDKENASMSKHPTLLKALKANLGKEENKRIDENVKDQEVMPYVLKNQSDLLNLEITEDMPDLLKGFLKEYPNIKVLFYFNTDIFKYHFVLEKGTIKLLKIEVNNRKNIIYAPFRDDEFRKEFVELLKSLITIYLAEKEDVTMFIKEGNYLIDENIYDLGDIEKLLADYTVVETNNNQKRIER